MSAKTWKERSEWMDKHHVRLRASQTIEGGVCCLWDRECYGGVGGHSSHGCDADAAIDRAMREFVELELQDGREKERRETPIAVLYGEWAGFTTVIRLCDAAKELDVAIDKQAKRWRTRAQHSVLAGEAAALLRCADELEGEVA